MARSHIELNACGVYTLLSLASDLFFTFCFLPDSNKSRHLIRICISISLVRAAIFVPVSFFKKLSKQWHDKDQCEMLCVGEICGTKLPHPVFSVLDVIEHLFPIWISHAITHNIMWFRVHCNTAPKKSTSQRTRFRLLPRLFISLFFPPSSVAASFAFFNYNFSFPFVRTPNLLAQTINTKYLCSQQIFSIHLQLREVETQFAWGNFEFYQMNWWAFDKCVCECVFETYFRLINGMP